MSDSVYLREKILGLQESLDQLDSRTAEGSECQLVQTRTKDTYPTTANTYYACAPIYVDGPASEGAAASFVPDPTRIIYALNLGTQVPPITTRLIVTHCGGRWVFRYDG